MKKILALLLLLSSCASRETTTAGVQISTQAEAEKVMNKYAAKSAVSEFDTLKAALFDNDTDAL